MRRHEQSSVEEELVVNKVGNVKDARGRTFSGRTNPDGPRVRGTHFGTLVLAAASIVGIVVCALLVEPFLGAITWALALAILFVSFHAWIETKLKHPNLAAMASVLTIVLLVVVPAAFLVERLSRKLHLGQPPSEPGWRMESSNVSSTHIPASHPLESGSINRSICRR
jgi:hypothetical protein